MICKLSTLNEPPRGIISFQNLKNVKLEDMKFGRLKFSSLLYKHESKIYYSDNQKTQK